MRKLLQTNILIVIYLSIVISSFPSLEIKATELTSLAEQVKRLKPSVVNISTTSVLGRGTFQSPFGGGQQDPFEEFFKRFFGDLPQREFKQRGLGSGFVLTEDGYIVTNNHVVEKATDIDVILEDGEKYNAKVIGKDPKTDVALLKINPKHKLPAVSLGDSEKLEIGDWVIAIGNPFGLGHTVTVGIVSAKGRSLGLGAYDDFIQTDAAINPGNSGGPLFNLQGQVVGVNTAIIAGGQGIGFAIPISLAKNIINQLKDTGKVVRGWLGVLVQQITPEIAEGLKLTEPNGALVSDVTPGGPAAKAGIQRQDVITEFNGLAINEMQELPKLVAATPPGTEVQLKYLRNGKEKTARLKVAEQPEEIAKSGVPRGEQIEQNLGLIVQEINPQIQRRLGIEDSQGVIITNVESGGPAQESGLRVGDLILEINKKQIKNLEDYRKSMDSIKNGETALLLIKRGKNTIYSALKVGGNGKG
ncbi:MAG TPA: DegQ family serine endoprotease [Thermodesulfobacteriota bacterium]|jgi:serine protease Do